MVEGDVTAVNPDNREPATAPQPALHKPSWARLIGVCACILLVNAVVQVIMGRSLLGPDGQFGFWEGRIYSPECSQRLVDPYSPSHIAHGIVFYFGLWLLAKRSPWSRRFILAVVLEAAWEILENSPAVIDRYRQTATAMGYDGDSILNSTSDILMMVLGFLLASRFKVWQTLLLLVLMELGCAWWIRDNLTLNVINLIHPVNAIERWQTHQTPTLVPHEAREPHERNR